MSEPQKPKRASERIVELIKEKIISGEYGPGSRFPAERHLAQELQVGRAAIREAFRTLELSGMVEIKRGSEGGAFVVTPSHKPISATIRDLISLQTASIADLTEARAVIERGVAELAAERIGDEMMADLARCIQEASEVVASGRSAKKENFNFHICLARASGNPVLVMLLSSVLDLMSLYSKDITVPVAVSKEALETHIGIVAALKAKNFDRTWELLHGDIMKSNERLSPSGPKSRSNP